MQHVVSDQRTDEQVISPELQFAVECCRHNFARRGEAVAARSGVDLDWERLLALAHFHRVEGLVWRALDGSAPSSEPLVNELSAASQAIAASNLRSAMESHGLLQDFAAAGVPLLFVKGLTVAALAYREPLLKMSWDIDILVAPEDVPSAAELLARRGFHRILPSPPADLKRWHRRSKESVWARQDGLHVELHSRLADNPRLIPGITVHSAVQSVEVVPGVRLPTLARDELFAYLCVHGASSAWFRLKWISDLAGLLAGASSDAIARLYERSQALGAERAAGQALLLA